MTAPLQRRHCSALRHATTLASLLASLQAGNTRAAEQAQLVVPLRIRVARCLDSAKGRAEAIKPAAWIDAHVHAASKILRPHGIRLAVEQETFSPARCALLTRGDRSRLARHVEMDGRVTVLVVRRVRDVDVPTYDLMGVHWRYRGPQRAHRGKRWLFLTARAKPPVLAHELAHYFGVPHDPAGGNLMTPGASSPAWKLPFAERPAPFAPRLSASQVSRLRHGIARFRRATSTP